MGGGIEGARHIHEALAAADVATPCPDQAPTAEAEGPFLSAMDAMAFMAHGT